MVATTLQLKNRKNEHLSSNYDIQSAGNVNLANILTFEGKSSFAEGTVFKGEACSINKIMSEGEVDPTSEVMWRQMLFH